MCRIGVLFACLVVCNIIQTSQCSPSGWTEPSGEIVLEAGTKLSIKCIVESNEPNISSRLWFYNKSIPIESEYIHQLNDTAIELVIPKVPEQESMIVCKLGDHGVTYNDIRVGRKPDEIGSIDCTSKNWNNMTCEFDKPRNPVTVNYELKYRVRDSQLMHNCNQPTVKNPYKFTCDISADSYRRTYQYFVFNLVASNAFGQKNQTFDIDNWANVVPDRPDKFTVTEKKSNSIEVSWIAPSRIALFPLNFDFELLINSSIKCGDIKTISLLDLPSKVDAVRPQTFKYTIPLNFAYTWYDISIRMKISTARNTSKMWSEWTKLQDKTTARQPDFPPEINRGGFNIQPNGDLYIYWKRLSECHWNGDNFGYVITTNKQPQASYEGSPPFIFERGSINLSKDIEINIASRNNNGTSRNVSTLIIPGKTRLLVGDMKFKKKLINKTYYLSWSPPERIKDIITSYTVFWCLSKTELINKCTSSIDFVSLDPTKTTFEYKSDDTINFAISANSETSTTGMMWAKCTTANSYEIGKILSARISKTSSREIEFEWSLDCTDSGIVAGYQIEYCPTAEPKTLECMEPEIKQNITVHDQTRYALKGLKPYTIYKIIIRMFSNSTMGPPSESLSNVTLEDAPSPVQNLKARNIGNTTVDLFWDEPLQFNGVLVFYEIYVNGKLNSRIDAHQNNTAHKRAVVENLLPFTNYDIVVQACTNKCSEPVQTPIKTAIGAPGRFEKQPVVENKGSTNIFNSSYTSGIIRWEEPSYKGGNLDFYELKTTFISSDSSVEPKETTIRLKSRECFMEKMCVNNVTGVYQFSVRAVNFLFTPHASISNFTITGSTELVSCSKNDDILDEALRNASKIDPYGYFLYSDWSQSYGHSCHYSSFDSKLTAFILISLIASLVFVVMVFYLYRKIKDMKDILIQMPPGLEDIIKDKEKAKAQNNGKPDLLHNVGNQFIMNEDENGQLLRRSMNGSINGGDCSSSLHSESSRSEMEPADIVDDIAYNGFGQHNSMKDNGVDNRNESFLINNGIIKEAAPILISSETVPISTPISDKYPKPNIISHQKTPISSGYVPAPTIHSTPILNSSGYVTHSMMNPMQSNGYTRVNELGKPIINNDKINLKTPIVATTDQEGISGYVTHKQLSDFGHRMQ